MATILQNQTGQIDEQVYSDRESIGVAVSPSNITPQPLAHRVPS